MILVKTLTEWILLDEDMLVEVFEGDMPERDVVGIVNEFYDNPALSVVHRSK